MLLIVHMASCFKTRWTIYAWGLFLIVPGISNMELCMLNIFVLYYLRILSSTYLNMFIGLLHNQKFKGGTHECIEWWTWMCSLYRLALHWEWHCACFFIDIIDMNIFLVFVIKTEHNLPTCILEHPLLGNDNT